MIAKNEAYPRLDGLKPRTLEDDCNTLPSVEACVPQNLQSVHQVPLSQGTVLRCLVLPCKIANSISDTRRFCFHSSSMHTAQRGAEQSTLVHQ